MPECTGSTRARPATSDGAVDPGGPLRATRVRTERQAASMSSLHPQSPTRFDEQIIAWRVAETNAARAQFLGLGFAIVFSASLVGDSLANGDLSKHAFMVLQALVSLLVAALVRFTPPGRRFAAPVFIVGMCVVSAAGAAHSAQFGGLDSPHFYGVYTVAPILIPMLVSMPVRIVGTCATVGAFVVVFALRRPDLFAHPMLHVPATYLIALSVISILTGRYIKALEEHSFLDVARLEAVASVLEARVLELAHEPAELRRAIARQLHDDIAQIITGARIQLDGWSRSRSDALGRLTFLLDDLAVKTRTMLDELRAPSAPGTLGVELARLARTYGELGLAVELVNDVGEEDQPQAPAFVSAIASITKEALTNSLRHGGAREATVSLVALPGHWELDIWDDGRGAPEGLEEGYGLLGIRERAESLGGAASVASYEGGVRLSVRLPRPRST